MLLLVGATAFAQADLADPTRPPAGLVAEEASSEAATGPVLQSVLIPRKGRAVAVIGGQPVRLGEMYGVCRLIKLTERETAILKYLYKAGDKIVGKAELLAEVWGYNPEATTHTVETHIYRLRQKIERPEQVIMTEDNGYRLKKKNA